jgi:16S rRNA (cytidine1402-2'-O)-methyltransferase
VARHLVTPGTLFVVATPLGHLGDLSPRAAETLRTVALVAAEDTRRTRTLLSHLDAHPRLVSFHAHSPPGQRTAIVRALTAGDAVALVTDAGTPTISDPGAALVADARHAGCPVVTVPGPSAVAAALSVSGLPADRYTFLGFIARRGAERAALLEQAAQSPWSVVLFEAPPRLAALLADLCDACGAERPAVVARELTKRYEEVRAGTLGELAVYYQSHEPRGELTVVVAGRTDRAPAPTPADARARAAELLAAGTSRRDVVRRVMEEFALPRNEAYRLVTEL